MVHTQDHTTGLGYRLRLSAPLSLHCQPSSHSRFKVLKINTLSDGVCLPVWEGWNGGEGDLSASEAISQNKQMKSCDKHCKETGDVWTEKQGLLSTLDRIRGQLPGKDKPVRTQK